MGSGSSRICSTYFTTTTTANDGDKSTDGVRNDGKSLQQQQQVSEGGGGDAAAPAAAGVAGAESSSSPSSPSSKKTKKKGGSSGKKSSKSKPTDDTVTDTDKNDHHRHQLQKRTSALKLQTATMVAVDHDTKLANAKALLTREKSKASVVSAPADITHHVHASVDPKTGEIANLPSEFTKQVYRAPQFGVEIRELPCTPIKGYLSPIPNILIQLLNIFEQANGFAVEGVFRIPPQSDELKQAQVDIQNQVERSYDPLITATLIKRWFTQLPRPLLAPVKPRTVVAACDEDDLAGNGTGGAVGASIAQLHEPNRSIFLWLLDLLVDLDCMSDENKMTSRALSVIWAPNLLPAGTPADFDDDSDPTVVLVYAKKMAKYMHKAIVWRMNQKPSRFEHKEYFPVDDLGEMVSYSDHPAYKKTAAEIRANGAAAAAAAADERNAKPPKKKKKNKKKKSKRKLRNNDNNNKVQEGEA